ncbi:energy transducer TonB [Sphingomicrobium arenosum]|uniref:energy transducer TonB n=1 Tax=Sphingomicrobium arenosum TaxID=2233861 RepID=UPI00223EABE7|nr:energy transducer TonB [Sphingomicrobium arenosum]
MLRMLIGAAALVAASTPAAAQVHQPSTRWQVDFGQTGCIALRKFGEGAGSFHLVVKPNLIGDRFELALVEDGWRGDTQSRSGKVWFDGVEQEMPALRYADRENDRVVTSWFADDLSDLSGVERLDVQFAGQRQGLALTQTENVVEALENCRVELGNYYNFREGALKEGPKGGSNILHARNYPKYLMLDEEEAIVRAMLLLDEEGAVVDCSLLSFAGDAIFLAQSCGIIRETAQFEPAIGQDGKPARSVHVTSKIHWHIVGKRNDALVEEFELRDAALFGRDDSDEAVTTNL